jgi:hypothetical protein
MKAMNLPTRNAFWAHPAITTTESHHVFSLSPSEEDRVGDVFSLSPSEGDRVGDVFSLSPSEGDRVGDVFSLSPSEGERAGVRGPLFADMVVLTRCAHAF